ncbi:hypothetical protein QBC34DRAFT_402683 [Podospora aff. communis PSN243]|uniref:Uncharacterized protein n=1 Tax=Podospora aff. communis PSN243 TaxID=3040156 RepID=A0AAV9GST0_9PEZI|nr:hypothetical protein QBC34DRAFT_402683 [Podospora aff. communis PSN243]
MQRANPPPLMLLAPMGPPMVLSANPGIQKQFEYCIETSDRRALGHIDAQFRLAEEQKRAFHREFRSDLWPKKEAQLREEGARLERKLAELGAQIRELNIQLRSLQHEKKKHEEEERRHFEYKAGMGRELEMVDTAMNQAVEWIRKQKFDYQVYIRRKLSGIPEHQLGPPVPMLGLPPGYSRPYIDGQTLHAGATNASGAQSVANAASQPHQARHPRPTFTTRACNTAGVDNGSESARPQKRARTVLEAEDKSADERDQETARPGPAPPQRQVNYADLFQDGDMVDSEIQCIIELAEAPAPAPPGQLETANDVTEPGFYVLRCTQHQNRFNRIPELVIKAAKKHMAEMHGHQAATLSDIIREFGFRVVDCDKTKASENNDLVKLNWFSKGFRTTLTPSRQLRSPSILSSVEPQDPSQTSTQTRGRTADIRERKQPQPNKAQEPHNSRAASTQRQRNRSGSTIHVVSGGQGPLASETDATQTLRSLQNQLDLPPTTSTERTALNESASQSQTPRVSVAREVGETPQTSRRKRKF